MVLLLCKSMNTNMKIIKQIIRQSSVLLRARTPVATTTSISRSYSLYQDKCYCMKQSPTFIERCKRNQFVHVGGVTHLDTVNKSCLVFTRSYAKKAKKEKGGKKGNVAKPKVELSTEEMNEVINFSKFKVELEEAVSKLKHEYIDQLTLRTSAGALDNLLVDTPDGKFPLIQLAQITQKNPSLYVIDLTTSPQYISHVKTAIAESGMNISPQQEKTTLFAPIPKVTREHRESLAKNAKSLCDKTKERLRHILTQYLKDVKKQKDQSFSEDLIRNLQETMQFSVKEHVEKAEEMMKAKQKDLLGN